MTDWKLIKTGPKDGTHVLLHVRWAGNESHIVEGWWNEQTRSWWTHRDPYVRATHWRELPEKPPRPWHSNTRTWRES